ncbi:DIRAS family, GTP-binding Ras-like 2 [Schistosoma bovis]|uniref:DIRAS family, GTP-binding Ras-like 2 n=1 Tax=Schistosoma bovis TaxID=6184 RepID=A0A430QSY0_SCHBO|nr:DIRAS family, GTP-binding Ras-like 2 [Schistosoma bovis]
MLLIGSQFTDISLNCLPQDLKVISCNRQVCTLQITDTTGSHQFPAMQRLSINKAHAFILVYSITNKASFDELQPLYTELALIR